MNKMQNNQVGLNVKRGFSLIELLVVISIIAVISGIVFSGYAAIKKGAQQSNTRTVMAALNGVAAQYELKTKKPIDNAQKNPINRNLHTPWFNDRNNDQNDDGVNHNVGDTTQTSVIDGEVISKEKPLNSEEEAKFINANLTSERFVYCVYRVPEISKTIHSIGDSFLTDEDDDGFYELRDAWGNGIMYVYNQGYAPKIDWLPNPSMPYFASPGPDGVWGVDSRSKAYKDLSAAKKTEADKYSKDNIYSFETGDSSR